MSGIPTCPECIHSGDSLDRAYRTEDKQAEHDTNDVCGQNAQEVSLTEGKTMFAWRMARRVVKRLTSFVVLIRFAGRKLS